MRFFQWLVEGARAGLFLRPRVVGSPSPLQLIALVLLVSLIDLGLSRLQVEGPARLSVQAWLGPWWSAVVILAFIWWVLQPNTRMELEPQRPGGVAAWMMLWMGATLPAALLGHALAIVQARGHMPEWLLGGWLAWLLYFAIYAWTIAVAVRLVRVFGASRGRAGALTVGLLAVYVVTATQFNSPFWEAEGPEAGAPQLVLSQEVFESQQALWQSQVTQIAPERPGVTDVYGLVFAPYAPGDVFLRESVMVADLLANRFDAQGRVLHMVNNAATSSTHLWATRLNLERGIAALAARMDREHDVLVVYMTSHGARDYKLAAYHGPLGVEPVSPGELRAALDKAGIRNRVIAVSACYSGGWVGPLADEGTLVMTAADADHTSFGCGRLSPLTFFGRAVFDEQLRKTHSFQDAFAAAVPVIKKREEEGGKTDGFSNPQVSVGTRIAPILKQLAQRLDALPAKVNP